MKTIEDLDQGTIRRIDWQELFPGVLLFRALTQAFRVFPILFGSLLLVCMIALTGKSPCTRDSAVVLFRSLVCPFYCRSPLSSAGLVLFCLVFLYFWLFLARRGAMRLVSTERVPLGQAFRFASARFVPLLIAAGIPLAGIVLCLAILITGGQHPSFYTAATPVLLAAAAFMLLIGIGLAVGLPMMAASVAVDDCDGFDAFSRAFSFMVQRPFHTLGYLVLALFFGAAGFALLKGGVIAVSRIIAFFNFTEEDCGYLLSNNLWSLFWWTLAVLMPYGFLVGYFCNAGVALYLILRKNLYGVAFDRIIHESEEDVRRLRPILKDELGAPVPADAGQPLQPAAEPAAEPADRSGQTEES